MLSLTVLLALFLSGCEVVFTNAPAGKPKQDKALIGRWLKEEEQKPGWVQFDEANHGQLNVSFLPAAPEERNPLFTAQLVTIADHSYMILNPTNEDRDKGFMIARYEISGDKLDVWTPSGDKFKALIKQKRITGEAASTAAMVTDSPENVARLLQSKEGADAFEYFGKFSRVKR